MKARRLELLGELDQLQPRLCKRCRPPAKLTAKGCNCMVSKRMREIGKELLELRETPTSALLKQLVGMKLKNFTPELYYRLRENEISDTRIREYTKWHSDKLVEWKRKHGINNEIPEDVTA